MTFFLPFKAILSPGEASPSFRRFLWRDLVELINSADKEASPVYCIFNVLSGKGW